MDASANATSGVIRTASGRTTYAPDGLTTDALDYSREGSGSDVLYEPMHTSHSTSSGSETEKVTDSDRQPSKASFTHAEISQLQRLATKDQGLERVNTLAIPDDDPSLDPDSKEFDLYKWLRKFIHGFDEQGLRPQRAGIVFKNLTVSGSGAALQLQQTVASILWSPFTSISFGRKQHNRILNKFNGVLKSGELLIVLGRPGSGCSTFLKSLCGELHGLDLDSESTIHYNGKSCILAVLDLLGLC